MGSTKNKNSWATGVTTCQLRVDDGVGMAEVPVACVNLVAGKEDRCHQILDIFIAQTYLQLCGAVGSNW